MRLVAVGQVMNKHSFVMLLVSMIWSTQVLADRQGYSVIGGGASLVDYEESSTHLIDSGVIDVETETATIATQSSGTFVSVSPQWGFYLHTLSTLGAPVSEENWELEGTRVRNNSVSFQLQRVGLLGSRTLNASQFHALFGVQYSKFEYRRFGAELTQAAAGFGIDENTFESGTVAESVWGVSALVGVERNTVFTDAGKGWRYQGRFLLGVPLISSIVNTSVANGKSFTESFNGAEIRGLGIIGYQFSQNFFVGASLEASYVRKNSAERTTTAINSGTEFPSTTYVSVFPGIGAYWSF